MIGESYKTRRGWSKWSTHQTSRLIFSEWDLMSKSLTPCGCQWPRCPPQNAWMRDFQQPSNHHSTTQKIPISSTSRLFLLHRTIWLWSHLYPNPSPSLTGNTMIIPNQVVGVRHKVKHLFLHSWDQFQHCGIFFFEWSLHLCGICDSESKYSSMNSFMTSEEMNDPDCEWHIFFGCNVVGGWLRNQDGDRSWGGRCFKVFATTKFLAPAVVNYFLFQIVLATIYYFFTVIYRGIFS